MLLALRHRLQLSGLIVLLYFVSVFLLSIFPEKNISTLSYGLFIASAGSTVAFLLLRQWEKNTVAKRPLAVHAPASIKTPSESHKSIIELERALTDSQAKNQELILKQNQLEDSLQKLDQEKAQFEHKIEDIHHELNSHKTESDEELRRKTTLLSEYQETINQQREVIRKKQEQISELESKVRDLNYEVKTLLQLAEIGNAKEGKSIQHTQTETPAENTPTYFSNKLVINDEQASQHLNKCIDIAQKITLSSRFGNGNSRFQNMPLDNSALDFRRLFDNLRSETSSSVIVYSLKENRLLFANQQIQNLLGWNEKKFIQSFSDIVCEGYEEWNQAINQLSSQTETQTRLLLKKRNGQNLLVYCHLRMIPTGIFRHFVIGVLYPS